MESRPVRKITPRVRNQFQYLTAAASGLTAFGALAGTGLVTGHVAASFAQENAAKAVATEPDPAAAVVTKRRPHRTVVRTVVVNRSSTRAVAAPGTGGTVRSAVRTSSSSGSRSTSSTPNRPAAPAPAPAPAPSSGS